MWLHAHIADVKWQLNNEPGKVIKNTSSEWWISEKMLLRDKNEFKWVKLGFFL